MSLLKNRTIGVLIICLPLVIIISLIKPNSSSAIYKVEFDRFWTYKVHSHKKFNMIVLGDSRVYRGISPQAINKVIPDISVCNFGFSSGKLNQEIFREAHKRLDKAAALKIILIGITPASLIAGENDQFNEIMKLSKAEVLDKIYVNFFAEKFVSPLKPSEFFRIKLPSDSIFLKETFYDNGWVSSKSNQTNHSLYLESYRKVWDKEKVSMDRINELYAQIKDWSNEDIKVFAFRVPSSEEMDKLENNMSGFDEVTFRNNIINNGGVWLDLSDQYNHYKSYDGSHLDDKSAILLSDDIAIEIKSKLKKQDE
jgi:hypothetical protein